MALVVGLVWGNCGCSTTSGMAHHPAESPLREIPAAQQPYILLVSSAARCNDRQGDIQKSVAADAQFVKQAIRIQTLGTGELSGAELPSGGVHLQEPDGDELLSVIRELARAGRLKSGLVLLYTGHGASVTRAGARVSQICLKGGGVSVHQVVDGVDALGAGAPPWLGLVLNACSSADVDISQSGIPVGVLAGSTSPITASVFGDGPEGGSSCHVAPPASQSRGQGQAKRMPRASAIVRAVSEAISRPSSVEHDRNQDGIVTLHELFHVVNDAVAANWRLCAAGRPEPRLQVQARSDIPVRFHAKPTETRAAIQAIIEELEVAPEASVARSLARELRAQLELAQQRRLPELPWDFVIAGPGTTAVGIPRAEEPASRPSSACGGLSMPVVMAPQFADPAREESLARFAMFTRFYRLDRVGSYVDLSLPYEDGLSRTQRILGVRRVSDEPTVVPARVDCQHGPGVPEDAEGAASHRSVRDRTRGRFCRAMREIPSPEGCPTGLLSELLAERQFRVCNEYEGQCFQTK